MSRDETVEHLCAAVDWELFHVTLGRGISAFVQMAVQRVSCVFEGVDSETKNEHSL